MSASSGRGRPRRSAGSSSSGLQLDANDPTDRKIIARQVATARKAGRDGLDRAASTRGRQDLEAAYDEGALQASAPVADGGGQDGPAPKGRRGKGGSGPGSAASAPTSGPSWKQFRPTSPTKPPRRLADAGGFATGLALYTVVVIYIRYGPSGWTGWLKAKFLNQPMGDSTSTSSATKPKTKKGGTAAV